MSSVGELHKTAMELAAKAVLSQRANREAESLSLFREAFEREREAALLLLDDLATEPTRSVLFRSAASLAIDCHDYREAERLVAIALAGNPPEEIADELRDLYESVNFGRHLELKGTVLGGSEVQISLAGEAVGFGIIAADDYFPRVQTVESMLLRTAERQQRLPFRERGKATKAVAEAVELYMSVPRAASFAVTLRIGRPQKQASLFDEPADVVAEFLECVRLFTEDDRAGLRDRINDGAYFRNFVQLAKKLAPDGQRVKTVGFTATIDDEKTTVALRGPASPVWTPKTNPNYKTIEIKGILTEASKKKTRNVIGIRNEVGKVRTIHVPAGLMNDIVRPLWDHLVVTTAQERPGKLVLLDIEPGDDTPWAPLTEPDNKGGGED